ncbi:MAG: hypothetical protein IKN72_09285, partial [Clostridia bacterium]|nr:hypothetical protein [Clostridia bacterium]
AAAANAKNSPPDCFLNAATVLQEITSYSSEQFLQFAGAAFLRYGTAGSRGTAAATVLREMACISFINLVLWAGSFLSVLDQK